MIFMKNPGGFEILTSPSPLLTFGYPLFVNVDYAWPKVFVEYAPVKNIPFYFF